MQLVIDIPKEVYKSVRDHDGFSYAVEDYLYEVEWAIKDGTPLPKGHGRLIDGDAMTNRLCTSEASEFFGNVTCAEISDFINDEKTIIEADKAESEDKEC